MTTRKPRRTQAQWAQIIDQQSQSGQTIKTFCEENDIGLASFGKWKQKLTKRIPGNNDSPEPMFRPVNLDESSKAKTLSAERTTVTLSFGSIVTLTIQANQPST